LDHLGINKRYRVKYKFVPVPKYCAMKTYGGVEAKLNSCIPRMRMVRLTLSALYPGTPLVQTVVIININN
jgi:hypothetical protein